MMSKAAIDFGNSNTVLAFWNQNHLSAEVISVSSLCEPDSFLIPSRIAYEPDGRFYLGRQIEEFASADAKEFRWMKRYINLRSPYSLRTGEKRIDAKQAAEDFLHTLTALFFSQMDEPPDELILSVPVESFEHYSEWLLNDMKRFENLHLRLVDEACAAAAGYGLSLHPGETLLVLDFGGSTLQAVCVEITEEGEDTGRCCRILGKSGCNLGGMTLDRWIFEFVLKKLAISENTPQVNRNSAALLRYCEKIKTALSENESVLFDFFPENPFLLTRDELNELFQHNGLLYTLQTVLNETIRTAEDHGFVRDALKTVIPVGGSCLLPAVQSFLGNYFLPEILVRGEPLGAVARGAAVIAGGMHIYDFIQHSYAIRYIDPQTGAYAFRTIIPRGTKYPSRNVCNPLRLKASYDGQEKFGIAIYELQESRMQTALNSEIFFDTDGSVHVMPMTEQETAAEKRFWMNERNPLFLMADTHAGRGVPQFTITFDIDENKMLLISAESIITGKHLFSCYPVVRLV